MTQLTDSKPRFVNRLDMLLMGALVLCTFALFIRARSFEFVEYDDHLYVYRNIHVLRGLTLANLRWASTAIVVGNWHPVTVILELVLSSLFGPTATVFHTANIVLHTLNVALLYLFLRKATGRQWAAFFTAGLWGLHGLRVESVVWISELKDVLCGAFWLSCMLVYLRYSQKRSAGTYALVALFHSLALMAKPMAATLPAALLLLDFWPLAGNSSHLKTARWWSHRVLEKLPLLALSIGDILFALRTQSTFVSPQSAQFPLALRLENGLISCVAYLRDIFFPHHLIAFYPHPAILNQTIPIVSTIAAGALLLLITIAVFLRSRPQPYLVIGWLWFLGTLLPVIGLVRLGITARADRYMYIPSIGITWAVVWLVSDFVASKQVAGRAAAAFGALAMIALSVGTFFTIGHWQNTRTLFDYIREVQPDNPLALCIYANELSAAGHADEALVVARHAVEISPKSAPTHVAYGTALQAADRLPEAVDEFKAALYLEPTSDEYWDGCGNVRAKQASKAAEAHDPRENDFREKAIYDFRYAIKWNPDAIGAREHLALELAALGKLDEAISVWLQLIALSPQDAQAQGDLADALRMKHDLPAAIEHYWAALTAGSHEHRWETSLSFIIATSPVATVADVQPLVAIAKDACDQTNYKDFLALDAYAACLARVGRFDAAVTAAQQGIAAANAANQPRAADAIQQRLALYQRGIAYVVGDPTTMPTTQPTN